MSKLSRAVSEAMGRDDHTERQKRLQQARKIGQVRVYIWVGGRMDGWIIGYVWIAS